MAENKREKFKQQLLATFQVELDEHLQTLNRGLLTIEEGVVQDQQAPIVADLLRAAHSLKGAARAVALREIETIAHRLEDILGAIQRGDVSPTRDLCSALFPAVDAMREAMSAHLRGESLPHEKRDRLFGKLDATLGGETRPGRIPPEPDPVPSIAAAEDSAPPSMASSAGRQATPTPAIPATGETIRVATAKLDALMASAGELLVARMRAERRQNDLHILAQQLTQWHKSWQEVRALYTHLQLHNHNGSHVAPLLDFLGRNEENLNAVSAELDTLH
jgi:two-component system, chemotaxis family, sensor kinase CheA